MKWYKFDIREFDNDEYNKWYSLLSKEKQQYVDSLRCDDDKKRSVAGEMLARKAIAEWCSVNIESILFEKAKHGKHFAKNLNIEFNISHSGDMVVCAVNDTPVGIDIEKIRPIDLKVAKRICTDQELYHLFRHTPTENDFKYTEDAELLTRFFKIWTAKESCGKCNGKGLADAKKTDCSNVESFTVNNEYVLSIKVSDSD